MIFAIFVVAIEVSSFAAWVISYIHEQVFLKYGGTPGLTSWECDSAAVRELGCSSRVTRYRICLDGGKKEKWDRHECLSHPIP